MMIKIIVQEQNDFWKLTLKRLLHVSCRDTASRVRRFSITKRKKSKGSPERGDSPWNGEMSRSDKRDRSVRAGSAQH